jgi:hypothetical protein
MIATSISSNLHVLGNKVLCNCPKTATRFFFFPTLDSRLTMENQAYWEITLNMQPEFFLFGWGKEIINATGNSIRQRSWNKKAVTGSSREADRERRRLAGS